jgi:hypothetical protein
MSMKERGMHIARFRASSARSRLLVWRVLAEAWDRPFLCSAQKFRIEECHLPSMQQSSTEEEELCLVIGRPKELDIGTKRYSFSHRTWRIATTLYTQMPFSGCPVDRREKENNAKSTWKGSAFWGRSTGSWVFHVLVGLLIPYRVSVSPL